MLPKIALIVNPRYKNDFVKKVLDKEYYVELFQRGIDAYTWIHSGNIPDLVIADEQLSDIDLAELISRFKNSSYYCDIPFLILPHTKDETVVNELLKSGAEDFVKFPIDKEMVLLSARNLLA